ncbi:hypothetical protein ACO22_07684 [Paracoccidioides brasiliensis]|uniref:Uncharacterized protein n=1 Tax=Paracoccidioides brasiliensis TaxID=121759 RepID=A0A1D2J426_PARBR|nr:hypothetical protein ACO22_07684 [Paracoccidioides brasiliensis]
MQHIHTLFAIFLSLAATSLAAPQLPLERVGGTVTGLTTAKGGLLGASLLAKSRRTENIGIDGDSENDKSFLKLPVHLV